MTSRILATSIALLLAPAAFAVTDTWDGGGANDNFATALNWLDNTAPLSDLVNTDLIFAGLVRLTPNVSAAFSTNSVTFNNTAGAFVFSGTTLGVGTGGVVNNDTQTMTFNNLVSFSSVASSTVNAASGGLTFTNAVALPAGTLTVDGSGATSFAGFSDFISSALTKQGAGTMSWAPPAAANSFPITVAAGTLNTVADGTLDLFELGASIAVNGTSAFNIGESLTLDNNVQLTRATGATLTLAAGKTLTIKGGADVSITGAFTNATASTIALSVAGSTFSTTSTLSINGGSTLTVNTASAVTSGVGTINIGTSGNGTVSLLSNGSLSGGALTVGLSGSTGSLTFSSSSTGNFGVITVANSATAGSSGTILVQSGSTVSGASLSIAAVATAVSGTLTVTGATAGMTITGAGATSIGAAGASVGALNVQNGGTFTSGTGTTAVNATGTLAIVGGILNQNGDLNVSGQLTRDGTGALNLAQGKTLTVQNGGDAIFTGPYATGTTPTNGANLSVNGAGSTLQTSGDLAIISGSTATVQTSATASAGSLTVGTLGTGTLTLSGSGVFTGGSGNSTVGPAGTVAISGGTFNANGNLTVNGGQLTRSGSGALNLATGTQFTVQGGGDAIFTGLFQQSVRSNLTVTGSGSTFTTSGDFQWDGTGNTLSLLNVNTGGLISSAGALHLGRTNDAVALTVNGAGSQIVASPNFTSEWQAGVLLLNGASATLGALKLADTDFGSNSFGSLDVQSGATAAIGNISAASGTAPETAAITVTGVGSVITQTNATGPSTLTLGAAFLSSATLTVNNGGAFTSGTGSITLNATGAINIGGGTVTLNGPLARNGGTVTFTSGALSIIDNWNVGVGGLLGANVTFDATRRMATSATTTVDIFQTLTLNGGTLSTGALVNNGAIAFNSGTLAVTGVGGFNIGTGALGANVTLGTGANLLVTNTATAAAGATLTMNGGTFNAGTLNNSGTIRANLGTASAASGTNNSGGRIFISDTLDISGLFVNASGGRITLENGSGLLSGAGTLSNNGLVAGDGTIAKTLVNNATGEVRGELGRTLSFTAAGAFNSGVFNLVGGTLDFTGVLTHNPGAFISGHGALFTGGLTNQGQMAFSGGTTDIRGDVLLQAGSRVATSGAGSTTTFFDDVVHNGLEIFTGAGASTVFYGSQSGAGNFTGTGTVYFIGDLRPGNSPAAVSYGGDLVFGGASSLTLEIGGLVSGTLHDHLDVTGALFADGDLTLTLLDGFMPQFGDTFDLLDVGTFAGDFDSISAPALSGGNAWDFSALKTTGSVTVVPEPGVGALLVSALGFLGMRRRGIRGARASRVLVSASRRDELPCALDSGNVHAFRTVQEVREGGMPSPARETRALPGTTRATLL